MIDMHKADAYVRLEKRTYADGGLSGALSSGCGVVNIDLQMNYLWQRLTLGCRLYFRLLPVGAREAPIATGRGSVVTGIEIEPSDLAALCLGSVGSSTAGAVGAVLLRYSAIALCSICYGVSNSQEDKEIYETRRMSES
jgi:hypothetical protein